MSEKNPYDNFQIARALRNIRSFGQAAAETHAHPVSRATVIGPQILEPQIGPQIPTETSQEAPGGGAGDPVGLPHGE